MKTRSLFLILMVAGATMVRAQAHYSPPAYTPRFDNTFGNFALRSAMFNRYYGTVSTKHSFRILYKDGRDTVIDSKIYADSPAYYVVIINKSVKKRDSLRQIKVYPSQTRSIARIDMSGTMVSEGIASDTCWLFKTIEGKISAYTPLAEDDIDDGFLRYIQKDNGPMVQLNAESLAEMVKENEKALRFAQKKAFTRAIKRYNKDARQ